MIRARTCTCVHHASRLPFFVCFPLSLSLSLSLSLFLSPSLLLLVYRFLSPFQGGSTLTVGFGPRLLQEVQRLTPAHTKIKIWAPSDRLYSTWLGASVLASLSTFSQLWISRAEYKEHGANIVFRKTF